MVLLILPSPDGQTSLFIFLSLLRWSAVDTSNYRQSTTVQLERDPLTDPSEVCSRRGPYVRIFSPLTRLSHISVQKWFLPVYVAQKSTTFRHNRWPQQLPYGIAVYYHQSTTRVHHCPSSKRVYPSLGMCDICDARNESLNRRVSAGVYIGVTVFYVFKSNLLCIDTSAP